MIIGEKLLGYMVCMRNRDSVHCQNRPAWVAFSFRLEGSLVCDTILVLRFSFVYVLRMMKSEDKQCSFIEMRLVPIELTNCNIILSLSPFFH